MVKYIKGDRRLSIISDIIIFILLSIAALLILGIFKEIIVSSSLEENSFLEINDTKDVVDLENIEYVNKIKEEFSISVKYGQSQKEIAKRVDATVQENNSIINNNIKSIYDALSKYDKNMFKAFDSEGYKISIIIFDKFNNDNLALASKNNLNQFTIYMSNVDKLERAFHHEICHILEYYLESKGINFDDWDSLNKEDFSYMNSTSNISSDNVYYFSRYLENNKYDSYFVTKYSKVNAKEDRAEIFAEVMSASSIPEYISDKTPIYYKYITLITSFKLNIPNAKFINYYELAF